MFDFLKKKPLTEGAKGERVTLKLDGMHCTSCSLNIDGALEDMVGVTSASTSYAKSETIIEFNPDQVELATLIKTITDLGYQARVI